MPTGSLRKTAGGRMWSAGPAAEDWPGCVDGGAASEGEGDELGEHEAMVDSDEGAYVVDVLASYIGITRPLVSTGRLLDSRRADIDRLTAVKVRTASTGRCELLQHLQGAYG